LIASKILANTASTGSSAGYAKGHRVNRAVEDHRAQETSTFSTGKTVALRVGVQSITRTLIFAIRSHLLTKRSIGDEG